MDSLLITNARIVNEGEILEGDVLIKNGRIEKIASEISTNSSTAVWASWQGRKNTRLGWLLPNGREVILGYHCAPLPNQTETETRADVSIRRPWQWDICMYSTTPRPLSRRSSDNSPLTGQFTTGQSALGQFTAGQSSIGQFSILHKQRQPRTVHHRTVHGHPEQP